MVTNTCIPPGTIVILSTVIRCRYNRRWIFRTIIYGISLNKARHHVKHTNIRNSQKTGSEGLNQPAYLASLTKTFVAGLQDKLVRWNAKTNRERSDKMCNFIWTFAVCTKFNSFFVFMWYSKYIRVEREIRVIYKQNT